MKTNKLIIYAAIGVGLWLLFRKKGNPITGKPPVINGIEPVLKDGEWKYPVPTEGIREDNSRYQYYTYMTEEQIKTAFPTGKL